MGLIAPVVPTAGQPRGAEEVDIINALNALITLVNGNIDDANIKVGANIVAAKLASDAAVPAGMIFATARASAPSGYLLCDGSAVARTGATAALFAAIGTAYGVGDGSTTFNLPDLRGRVPVGVDGAAARLAANDALGNSAGEEKHTLLTAEMPSHQHGMTGVSASSAGSGHAHGFAAEVPTTATVLDPGTVNVGTGGFSMRFPNSTTAWNGSNSTTTGGTHSHSMTGSADAAGGGGSHNVMQPFQVVNWLIKT